MNMLSRLILDCGQIVSTMHTYSDTVKNRYKFKGNLKGWIEKLTADDYIEMAEIFEATFGEYGDSACWDGLILNYLNMKFSDESKYYRVRWIYLNEVHFCYVKALSMKDARRRVEKMLNTDAKITEVTEVRLHQIASPNDICVNFKNPRIDEDKLCG